MFWHFRPTSGLLMLVFLGAMRTSFIENTQAECCHRHHPATLLFSPPPLLLCQVVWFAHYKRTAMRSEAQYSIVYIGFTNCVVNVFVPMLLLSLLNLAIYQVSEVITIYQVIITTYHVTPGALVGCHMAVLYSGANNIVV